MTRAGRCRLPRASFAGTAAVIFPGVAVVGRLTGPVATMLVTAGFVAVLSGFAWTSAYITLTERPATHRSVLVVVAVAAGAPFYSYGAHALRGLGTALTLILLSCTAVAVAGNWPPRHSSEEPMDGPTTQNGG